MSLPFFGLKLPGGSVPGSSASDFLVGTDQSSPAFLGTDVVDGKKGTLSFWFRLDDGDGTEMRLLRNTPSDFLVTRGTGNSVRIFGQTSSGVNLLNIATVASYVAGATWYHLLASWDLSAAGRRYIYVDDVSDIAVTTFVNGPDEINYEDSNSDFFIVGHTTIGFVGCLSEFFFENDYLDLSVEANRRKFRTAAGKPADLGANGSTPFGSRPWIYSASGNMKENAGTTGIFTGDNPTTCSSVPG